MKKIFSFFAALLFAGSLMAQAEEVNVTSSSGVQIYKQETYWQVLAQTETIGVSLLAMSPELEGTYDVADLIPDYSFVMTDFQAQTKIGFTAGQVVVAVDMATETVTFVGKLTAADGKIFNINLTYVEPKVEKTVTLTFGKTLQFLSMTGTLESTLTGAKMLFTADKLMALVKKVAGKMGSSSGQLGAIAKLADGYDSFRIGFKLTK